jgi:hypothetical protein
VTILGRWGLAAVGAVVAGSLACGGLGGTEEEVAPPQEEAPPEEEADSPLVLDEAYAAEEQSLTFRDDGTCEHVVGNTYACTWAATEAEGAWTVEITGYTGATDPDGAEVEVDREAGEAFEVAEDGATLTGAEGLSLALAEEGEGDEDEDEAGEDEDEGATDAAPQPRPRPVAPKRGAQGARPREGTTGGDEGGTKAGKGGKAKGAKPR